MQENDIQSYHSTTSVSNLGKDFDPLSDVHRANPYLFFARAREEEPICFSPTWNMWIVSRYDDVRTILKDPKRFSSAYLAKTASTFTPEAINVLKASNISSTDILLAGDAPGHTRARRPLTNAFSAQRVASLEPSIRRFATRLIDRFISDGRADLLKQFTRPLPSLVIFSLLGLPEGDFDQIGVWVEDSLALILGYAEAEQQVHCAHHYLALQQYLLQFIEQRRAAPQDDFVSDLLQAVKDEQIHLSETEFLGLIFSLVSGGCEAATRAICIAMYILLEEGSYWQTIQAKPDFIPTVVEEILRFDSPTFAIFRVTTEEVVLNGITIPKDELIYISFSSANHDEAHFANAECFDPSREGLNYHIAFGYGTHFCLGAPLALLQMRVALETLSQRLPTLQIAPDNVRSYMPSICLRAPLQLLVEWDTTYPSSVKLGEKADTSSHEC